MSADSSAGMLADAVRRALDDVVTPARTLAAEAQGVDRAAWSQLQVLGLVGEASADLQLDECVAVVREIGRSAALVPFVDSEGIARWLARGAGIATRPEQALAVLCLPPGAATRVAGGVRLEVGGACAHWGRFADRVLIVFSEGAHDFVVDVPAQSLAFMQGANLAGEPLDRCGVPVLGVNGAIELDPRVGARNLQRRGALLRAAAMSGAAERALQMTLQYARDRKQFGRSLSDFQVVQSHLAQMAEEVTAAHAMLDACVAAGVAGTDGAEVAALKVRVGQAVQVVSSLSHQIHGAIGFTQEYSLHLLTRRMWSWREEYGNESQWAAELGACMIEIGADDFWQRLTG